VEERVHLEAGGTKRLQGRLARLSCHYYVLHSSGQPHVKLIDETTSLRVQVAASSRGGIQLAAGMQADYWVVVVSNANRTMRPLEVSYAIEASAP